MTSVLSATVSLLILASTDVAFIVSEAWDLISSSPSLSLANSSKDSTSVILAEVGTLLRGAHSLSFFVLSGQFLDKCPCF